MSTPCEFCIQTVSIAATRVINPIQSTPQNLFSWPNGYLNPTTRFLFQSSFFHVYYACISLFHDRPTDGPWDTEWHNIPCSKQTHKNQLAWEKKISVCTTRTTDRPNQVHDRRQLNTYKNMFKCVISGRKGMDLWGAWIVKQRLAYLRSFVICWFVLLNNYKNMTWHQIRMYNGKLEMS